MKLNLIAVGTKMPNWVTQGFEEYSKRMPRECKLLLNEIAPAKRSKTANSAQWMQEEGQRILTQVDSSQHVVTLDVKGKPWTTEQLAEQLANWQANGRDVSLLVGGPDGLSQDCYQRADQSWSLSPLTLPHPLVRIVLAEQLYRAWTILQNHPYHRS
jgi:23S rRNA (pseudouridine1915-N3)-methyltransferase